MQRHILMIPILLLGLFASSHAQDAKKEPAKSGAEVDIHFLNGTTVRAFVQSETVEIVTPYGKLAVPLKEVRAIEFGAHLPAGHAEKIESAVKRLGSGDFKEREKAAAALMELGPHSYAAAVGATRSKDAETSRRAKDVVAKMQAKFPRKDLKVVVDDRILTPTFPIVGRIVTSSFKAKAEYFGDLELNIADMRNLRGIGFASLDVDVSVDASKYGNRNREWMATTFEVDGRTAIDITAKGMIDLAPENQGEIMCGPAGYRAGPGFGKKGFGGMKGVQGTLLGRIGETGETFVIGDRFEGTPSQEGKLYLQINPSNYSQAPSGSYDVKIIRKD
jgi:hypothetical protein